VKLTTYRPVTSLSKGYFRQGVDAKDIETFGENVRDLLKSLNETESEEFNKKHIREFLSDTYYAPQHEINTRERNDLVIHHGAEAKTDVGVIIETKKPGKATEMISEARPNVKALHELIAYYLRERHSNGQHKIKHLIATDGKEWFIFDEVWFENNIYQKLKKEYLDFQASGNKTEHFYKSIERHLDSIDTELPCTYINLSETFDKKGPGKKELIALYKIFAPQQLLKKPFANDSNTLNKGFYYELLYILGLEEKKDGGKKLIARADKNRRDGSLLEATIHKLQSSNKWSKLDNLQTYGETEEQQLFSIALELCINWLNRILFLKLLEGQLKSYHRKAGKYTSEVEFLNIDRIASFGDLNDLFFEVLAKPIDQRQANLVRDFANIPYLNSSLFELSELEDKTIEISQLNDRLTMPPYGDTILKDEKDKKKTKDLPTLAYLFDFLGAYDFSSDEHDELQRSGRQIINAAVLGLIFEKINGYKDGSFYTPGFITMYMSREVLRRAVVQKFNEKYNWTCTDIKELRNELYTHKLSKKDANEVVNSLKVCDPAVGSGHFLVSVLNEMIAIKHDLHILIDKEGVLLTNEISIDRDELVVMEEGNDYEFYQYNYVSAKSQRVQETLFHEKQTIIENCLFGVDINPKSVMICRLRLWIELLKNAYYTSPNPLQRRGLVHSSLSFGEGRGEVLQTLPNIDINIKCGNSLVSRFNTDFYSDNFVHKVRLKEAFIKAQEKYALDVYAYKECKDKKEKEEIRKRFKQFKERISELFLYDQKEYAEIRKQETEADNKFQEFNFGDTDQDKWHNEIEEISTKIAEKKRVFLEWYNEVYGNAFEWRFEFPEILDIDGNYLGFDVVIGNPPYIRQEELKAQKLIFKTHYKSYSSTADLLVYFIEKGLGILKPNGELTNIISSKFIKAGYGKPLREWLQQYQIRKLIDFGDLPVFEEATTYPLIIAAQKNRPTSPVQILAVERINSNLDQIDITISQDQLKADSWSLSNRKASDLIDKIKANGVSLNTLVNDSIYYGIKTALNEAFVISKEKRAEIIKSDEASAELIKPFLAGKDIKSYGSPEPTQWVILIPKGFTIKRNLPKGAPIIVEEPTPRYGNMPYDEAWEWLKHHYRGIADHLLPYREKAKIRTDQGDYWWELRACDYYDEFQKKKIVWPGISSQVASFALDKNNCFGNDNIHFIVSDDSYLLGVLNSRLSKFQLVNICDRVQGGFYRLKMSYIKQLAIKEATTTKDIKNQNSIIKLTDKILAAKKKNAAADTSAWEREIDALVYQLYDLTPDEIAIVESV
jgi:adenine-specific DNA-methyltransferase